MSLLLLLNDPEIPELSVASTSIATDGLSITSVTNSESTLQMSVRSLIRPCLMDTSDESFQKWSIDDPDYALAPVGIESDSSSFTAEFVGSGVAAFRAKLHCEVDGVGGSIKLHPELVMGSGKAGATHYFSGIEVSLPIIGNASDCSVVLPSTMGIVVPFLDDLVLPDGTEVKWGYPGLQNKGSGAGANPATHPRGDVSWNVASFFPVVALYNRVTGVGGILRVSGNNNGRGCAISLTRSGSNIIVALRMIPIDHQVGVNGASDEEFDYSLQIKPFASIDADTAWYDISKFHSDELERESHPSKTVARVIDRPSSGSGYFPNRIRNLEAFAAMTQGDLTDPTFDFDTLYRANGANLVNGFAHLSAAGLCLSIYNYTSGRLWANHPSLPFAPGAAQAVIDLYDLGITISMYTVQALTVDGLTGLGLDIENHLVLDENGDPITGVVAGSSAPEGLQYQMSFLDDSSVSEVFGYQVAEITDEVGTKFWVIYMDGLNAVAPPADANSALSSDDRGTGSKTFWPKLRASLDLMRAEMVTAGIVSPSVFTEHPNPNTVGTADFCFNNMIGPGESFLGALYGSWDYITPRFPSFIICHSPETIVTDFASFGDGPTAAFDGLAIDNYATVPERFNSLYSFNWHNHQLPSFLRYFEVDPDSVYFPDDASEGYLEWAEFVDRMCFKNGDAVRHWNRCKKLRDLPDSQHVRSIEAYHYYDSSLVLVEGSQLHHSVVHDDRNDEVILRFTNWSMVGHNPVEVQFTTSLTVDKWPELGTIARDVWLWDWSNDSMTPMTNRDTGSAYQLTVVIPAGFVGVVMMVPRGVLPTFSGTFSVEAMHNAARSVWSTGIEVGQSIPTQYDNAPFTQPENGIWARVKVSVSDQTQVCFGKKNTFKTKGQITANIHFPITLGDSSPLSVCDSVAAVFDGLSVSSAMLFRQSTAQNGYREGDDWVIPMVIPFESTSVENKLARVAGSSDSFEELGNNIRSYFDTNLTVAESLLTHFDNAPFTIQDGVIWARMSVQRGDRMTSEIGASPTYRTVGRIVVSIFIPIELGDMDGLVLGDKVRGVFRTVTIKGVTFRSPTVRNTGRDGSWWRVDVTVPFNVSR